jgi:hypothetical protein
MLPRLFGKGAQNELIFQEFGEAPLLLQLKIFDLLEMQMKIHLGLINHELAKIVNLRPKFLGFYCPYLSSGRISFSYYYGLRQRSSRLSSQGRTPTVTNAKH